jgi:hypothetical protein
MTRLSMMTAALLCSCIGYRDPDPNWSEEGEADSKDGTGEGEEEEVQVEEGCDEDDIDRSVGFSIEGSVYDIDLDSVPADPSALCAYVLDPIPVLSGGDPITVAATQVCDNGDYVITGLSDPASIGMFVSIDDCEGNPDTVMRSATGVDFDDMVDLRDGDSLTGFRAYLINNEFAGFIGTDLTGFDGNVMETGFMAGFARNIDDEPVGGAALACGDCTSFYYLDTDWDDGLFATGGTLNTQTDANAMSMFVAPAAPIFTYEASDGGAHTWDPQLFGSLPGYASFLLFNAL